MSLTDAKELTVLSLLAAHDLHGYAIATSLEQGFGGLLGIKRSSIYAMLERFQKRGWTIGTPEQAGNYPDREVFSLTPAGRAAMSDLLEKVGASSLPQTPLLALLLALEASGHAPDLDALIEERAAALKQIETVLGGEHGQSPSMVYAKLVLEAETKALRILAADTSSAKSARSS